MFVSHKQSPPECSSLPPFAVGYPGGAILWVLPDLFSAVSGYPSHTSSAMAL